MAIKNTEKKFEELVAHKKDEGVGTTACDVSVLNEKTNDSCRGNVTLSQSVTDSDDVDNVEIEVKENGASEKAMASKPSSGKKIHLQGWNNVKCCFFVFFILLFFIWLAGFMAYSQGHLDKVVSKIRKALNW